MRQWIRSAFVQIMACHLFGTKPIIKASWKLRSKIKWNLKYKYFIHENAFENIVNEMAAILSRRRRVNWSDPLNLQQANVARRWSTILGFVDHNPAIVILPSDFCVYRLGYPFSVAVNTRSWQSIVNINYSSNEMYRWFELPDITRNTAVVIPLAN